MPQKPPLVLIHGMWAAPGVWDAYRRIFEAQGFEVHTPPLLFHDVDPQGPVPEKLGKTSLTDYADAIELLIKSLRAPPVVIGHSMGGLVAQILAARGCIGGAVLLMPAPPAGVANFHLSVIKAFLPTAMIWRFWQKPVARNFKLVRKTVFKLIDDQAARKAFDAMVWESGRVIAEIGFWPLDRRHAARVRAKDVSCPVLVMAGRLDGITPAATVMRVARRYADSTYIELPHNAHWIFSEPGWDVIPETCTSWIKRNFVG